MNVVLLGSPGAGKGTQAEMLAHRSGFTHVATGDIFRRNVRDGTELGKLAQTYMDRGDLVPDEVTIRMLIQSLESEDGPGGVIFDGFPRNLVQARALDEALAARGEHVEQVILVEVSDEEAVRRLSARWLCSNCGAIYHQVASPPRRQGICDNCGSELYQRADDRPEVVRTRLEGQKPPADMIEHYRGAGKLHVVNGEQSLEQVHEALDEALGIPYAH